MTTTPASPSASGILLCDDLIFVSKVTGAARALGLTIKAARSMEVLLSLTEQTHPRCIIIDLANPGLNLDQLLTSLRASLTATPRVVAYGSHVDTETLRHARDAGCRPVWPRSKFVEELETALPEWLRQTADETTTE